MNGKKTSQLKKTSQFGSLPNGAFSVVTKGLTGSLNLENAYENGYSSISEKAASKKNNMTEKVITMLFGLITFKQIFEPEQEVEPSAGSLSLKPELDVASVHVDKLKTLCDSERTAKEKLQYELRKKDARISELKTKLGKAMESSSTDAQQIQKQLTLEQTVVRELAQRLEIVGQEKDKIKEDCDSLKHGHAKSISILKEFLNDFAASCLCIPLKSQFKAVIEGFKEKIEYIAEDIKTAYECTVLIAQDEENESNLLSEYDDEDEDIDISAISDADAKDALIRFIERKRKYSKVCNRKIIGNLRRVREMSLKLKSTEESLKQVLAEKELRKEQFLQENTQLRKLLREYDEIWGTSRSVTVESLRTFVRELEAVRREVFAEKEKLGEEVEKLLKENVVLQKNKKELGREVARLEEEAFVEAKRTVQEELEKIKEQNRKIEHENKTLNDGTSEEISMLRRKLEALQKDWEVKTKENAALQREIRAVQEKSAQKEEQFLMPSHSQLQARHGARRALADERLPVHSLPYGGRSASGVASTMSASSSAVGRDLPSGRKHSANGGGPLSLASSLPSQSRQLMQCLKCSAQFPVTNIEHYETHIRKCYNVTNRS